MGSEVRGLFFDLDGTLCDTDQANYEAYARAFRDEGITIDPEAFTELQGRQGLRADAFIPKLAPGIAPEAVARIRAAKAKYYPDCMHLVAPNEQLINFIRMSRGQHTTALVTTAQRANALGVLKHAAITDLFDHMVFGGDVTHPKPHPEAYLKALEISGLDPNDVIAFEDSESGVASAAAAGLKVIRVKVANAR